MARVSVRAFNPHTEGPIADKLDEHDDALDLIEETASDVISRQTLGADAQEIVLAVADTDERVVIEGYGNSGGAVLTLIVNNGATAVAYARIRAAGGAVSGDAGAFGGGYDGPMGFFLEMDIKNIGLHRGGISRFWSKLTAGANRQYDLAALTWANATDNVTSLTLHGDIATAFKSGFRIIVRRKKMT